MKHFLTNVLPRYWKGVLSAIPFVTAVVQTVSDYAGNHTGPYLVRDYLAIAVGAATTIAVVAKANAPAPEVEGGE